MSIRIDKEFESLIPPLSDEEFAQLEENCVRDGIRDALVVWKVPNGDQILVDGHNRWKISVKHGGIPFQVKELEFELREDAIAWIIRNQFGRRNLSAYDRSVLALKLKPILEKEAKKRQHLGLKSDEGSRTDKALGKIAGVGKDTIRKVEVIEKQGSPALIEDVRKGDTTINKAYQIVTGDTPKSPQKAMKELLQKKTEEHEQFLEKKNDKVVGLNDAREDNERMKLLASKFYVDWLHMDKLAFNMLFDINENLDFKGIMKALSDSQKAEMKQTITSMRQMADELEGRLLNGE